MRLSRLKIQRSSRLTASPGSGIEGSIPELSIFMRISRAAFHSLLANWRAALRRVFVIGDVRARRSGHQQPEPRRRRCRIAR